jgi:hypothetical protein
VPKVFVQARTMFLKIKVDPFFERFVIDITHEPGQSHLNLVIFRLDFS